MLKKKLNKKGFSLVELIVVIAIMAILAAIIIPTVTSKIRDANEGSANQAASGVANGIQSDITSINAGLTTNLTYLTVTGTGEAKTISVKDDYKNTFDQGNAKVTITPNEGTTTITVTAMVGNRPSDTYTVAVADGKITITEAAA